MSMLEWLGEAFDPGPVGTVELGGAPDRRATSGAQVVMQLVGAGILLALAAWVVFGAIGVRATSGNIGKAALITACYLGVAWLIRPRPDHSNMGWMGGVFDNPFRYSDDWNRNLLFLALLLMPGRFVAESLIEAVAFPFLTHPVTRGPAVGRWRRR